MPTHNREQRQILLEQRYERFRVVLSYVETDDDGAKLKGSTYISNHNVHSWRIIEKVLDDFVGQIMSVKFDGDTLQVRYLCPEGNQVFCNVFDYIVVLYEDKQKDIRP